MVLYLTNFSKEAKSSLKMPVFPCTHHYHKEKMNTIKYFLVNTHMGRPTKNQTVNK